jgi:hypothetical protein
MCCNNMAFLKALESCWHGADDRNRREMAELRKAARRAVAAQLVIQVGRLWQTVVKVRRQHPASSRQKNA